MKVLFAVALAALSCAGCSASLTLDPPPTSKPPPVVTVSPSAPKDIRPLIESQFAQSASVYRRWWPQYVTPALHLLGTDSSSGAISPCGPLSGGDAFYCPADNGVYLDLGMMQDFSRLPRGDGATLATVAHELGHAWQTQRHLEFSGSTVMNSELHADCLSGAVIAAIAPGSDALAQGAADAYASGSMDWTNPQFHGTPTQRRDVTLRGAGGLAACDSLIR